MGKSQLKRFKAMTGNVCDPRCIHHQVEQTLNKPAAGAEPLAWQAVHCAKTQQPQP